MDTNESKVVSVNSNDKDEVSENSSVMGSDEN